MTVLAAPPETAALERDAHAVAAVLRALANGRRLQILCVLIEVGDAPVGLLVDRVGISQSALSQHLARMREEAIVAFRRDGQSLRYRIADPRVAELIGVLHGLYCRRD